MDLAAIKSRLAGSNGRLYWRSLGELADTPEFREYLHREFPEQASEWNDPQGRRNFLKLMSASLALAGVGAAAGRNRPWPPALLCQRGADERNRDAGAGRKPHGATDQNRRKS